MYYSIQIYHVSLKWRDVSLFQDISIWESQTNVILVYMTKYIRILTIPSNFCIINQTQ